jgi:hypothetical protein
MSEYSASLPPSLQFLEELVFLVFSPPAQEKERERESGRFNDLEESSI